MTFGGWSDGATTGGGSKGFTVQTRASAMEKIVRAFQDKNRTPPPARRKPVESDGDLAILTWGGEISLNDPASSGFSINNPGTGPQDTKAERKTRVYTEVSRATKVIRVTNPDDESQYVDVERITSITFSGPDGVDVIFNLKST
jgi:hypothetical protein